MDIIEPIYMRFPISKNALQAFSDRFHSMKTLFDNVGDHIIVTDPNGNILYANHAAAKNSGFRVDEMIGRNPGDLWGGQMKKEFYEHMWKTLKQKKQPFVAEIQNKKKDGTLYWQELHQSPILDENGEVIFIVGIEPNITDRKEKEKFRDEFISVLGHQIRNPLTGTKWLIELLEKDLTETQHKEIIEELEKSNASMLELITDLLTVAKLNGIQLPTEMCEMEKELQNMIDHTKRKYPHLEVHFDDKTTAPPHIETNKPLALQVFENIITNAAEYSARPNGHIGISIQSFSDHFLFSIENDGLVIEPKDQPNIFKKLFRAENAIAIKSQGSGLGLYIVQMICHKLGWQISFQSPRPDKIGGTVFIAEIPKHVSVTPGLTKS